MGDDNNPESKDLKTFEPSRLALQTDSCDPENIETYGMPAFEYKGW